MQDTVTERQQRSPQQPGPDVRRARTLALGALGAVLLAIVVIVALSSSGGGRSAGGKAAARHGSATTTTKKAAPPSAPSSYAVGLTVMRLTDTSRTITLPNGMTEPRTLVTEVRYPASGSPGEADVRDAPPARQYGPFPLVVFGHGYDVKPSLYKALLDAWAHAGYVVAAPTFPLENPDAPGGPNESDLPNQPADVTFAITRLLAASSEGGGPLAGLISPSQVAVAGHSDGGDTALAAAYDARDRDSRIDAAVILSGAEIPANGSFSFPAEGPPLLATQGTADTVNLPSETEAFFSAAHRPKYLLKLLGAEHLGPYTTQQPQLGIVERVTTAFLDGYLEHRSAALARLQSLGEVPGAAALTAEP